MSTTARLDLLWLAEHAADLVESKFRGTPRPWQQPAALSADQREDRDTLARAERHERDASAIGEHPAPVHVDVLDLLVDLLATADDLAARISQAAGVEPMRPAESAFADPAPYLRHAATHLAMAGEALPELEPHVEAEAARLRYALAKHFGEFVYGQTLQGHCPWCNGGARQAFTLRVRDVGGRPAIVCESGTCAPAEENYGITHRGMPAWDLNTEGAWLAECIDAARRHREEAAA